MATDDDPAKRLKKGFDVMWRVARSVSGELKEELARRDFAKDVDDAGRGLLRTASGVVDEVKKNLDRSGLGPKIEGAGREVFRATADVVVRAPGLRTPRIDMQRCSHSMTTMAPRG